VKFYSEQTGITNSEPIAIEAGEMQKLDVAMTH
jgi:hypothetical protein